MKNLLVKECVLAASPLTYLFLAFSLMTMIPGYPILLGAFFVCYGLFQACRSARENRDLLFTALLPVKKADMVKARFLFACLIQGAAFALMLVFTILRMAYLGNSRVYAQNFMMNANPVYLAWCLVIFAAFNGIFLTGFFKTGWKFGKPFVAFMIAVFLIIAAAETLHHLLGLAFLNAIADPTGDIWPKHWAILASGLVLYGDVTVLSLKRAIKLFDRVDL